MAYSGQNTLHPIVRGWITNIYDTISLSTVVAVQKFITKCETDNILSGILLANVFAPDNMSAALAPLIIPNGFSQNPWLNIGTIFNSGSGYVVLSDLNISGLAGNGSAYLDTNIPPGQIVADANSIGIAMYISHDDTSTYQSECGATDFGGSNALRMYTHLNDHYSYVWMYGTNNPSSFCATPVSGYFAAYRTSSSGLDVYAASGTHIHTRIMGASGVNTQTPSTSLNMVVFATNENNNIVNFSKKRMSFFALTTGFSSGDSSKLYNAVQQLRKDFGGGWV